MICDRSLDKLKDMSRIISEGSRAWWLRDARAPIFSNISFYQYNETFVSKQIFFFRFLPLSSPGISDNLHGSLVEFHLTSVFVSFSQIKLNVRSLIYINCINYPKYLVDLKVVV